MPTLPLLLGHRGARVCRCAPENTIASFDLALEHGCDGFEFDVRGTADRKLVICHDPRVGRATIARTSRAQLFTLPCLDEVLERYRRRAFLDIEIKVGGLETAVLAALREQPPETDYVVSSFLPEVVMELKARNAKAPLGIIAERKSQLSKWPELPVEYVIAEKSLVNEKLVAEVHAAGRKLMAWTVNEAKSMREFAAWGVDALISDDTKLLVTVVRDSETACEAERE